MGTDLIDPKSISISSAWRNSRVVRPVWGLIALAAVTLLIASAWNDPGSATGLLQWRIFLAAYLLTGVVTVLSFFPADLWGMRASSRALCPFPPWVLFLTAGAIAGVAVGITDWTDTSDAVFRQLGWTFWLLVALLGSELDNRKIELERQQRLSTPSLKPE